MEYKGQNKIKDSVIDLGSSGKDIYYGYGLINAELALINTINYDPNPPSGGGLGGGALPIP